MKRTRSAAYKMAGISAVFIRKINFGKFPTNEIRKFVGKQKNKLKVKTRKEKKKKEKRKKKKEKRKKREKRKKTRHDCYKTFKKSCLCYVVYFDQPFGTEYSKRRSKYYFSTFFALSFILRVFEGD